jgi:hypothetical protein
MSVGVMPEAAAYGMPVMKAWTQLRRLSAVKMLMAADFAPCLTYASTAHARKVKPA